MLTVLAANAEALIAMTMEKMNKIFFSHPPQLHKAGLLKLEPTSKTPID
jgi:hypothetical protein